MMILYIKGKEDVSNFRVGHILFVFYWYRMISVGMLQVWDFWINKFSIYSNKQPICFRWAMPLLFVGGLLFCTGCQTSSERLADPVGYAQWLRMKKTDQYTLVEVVDAWNPTCLLQRYILVDKDQEVPQNSPEGILIRTPLERVVMTNAVHAAWLADMGGSHKIVGMCDTEYLHHPLLRKLVAEGTIQNLGSSLHPSIETWISLRPDGAFVSPFENAGHGALSSIQTHLIECLDYMETSALGRAEWMRFYGELFGLGDQADSLFQQVVQRYNTLCNLTKNVKERPTLFCDLQQGNAWYVPGGNSYLGQIFKDAGADYLFVEYAESGSVPLSFEQVFHVARDADLWLVKYASTEDYTYPKMVADDPLYQHFKAWKNQRVFHCNTLFQPFFEEVPFHPDLLLENLIHLFHPELLPETNHSYYTPLP